MIELLPKVNGTTDLPTARTISCKRFEALEAEKLERLLDASEVRDYVVHMRICKSHCGAKSELIRMRRAQSLGMNMTRRATIDVEELRRSASNRIAQREKFRTRRAGFLARLGTAVCALPSAIAARINSKPTSRTLTVASIATSPVLCSWWVLGTNAALQTAFALAVLICVVALLLPSSGNARPATTADFRPPVDVVLVIAPATILALVVAREMSREPATALHLDYALLLISGLVALLAVFRIVWDLRHRILSARFVAFTDLPHLNASDSALPTLWLKRLEFTEYHLRRGQLVMAGAQIRLLSILLLLDRIKAPSRRASFDSYLERRAALGRLRARLLFRRRKFEWCISATERAASDVHSAGKSQHPALSVIASMSHFQLQRFEEAVELADTAAEMNRDPALLLHRSCLYWHAGDEREARRLVDKLANQPNANPVAIRHQCYFRISDEFERVRYGLEPDASRLAETEESLANAAERARRNVGYTPAIFLHAFGCIAALREEWEYAAHLFAEGIQVEDSAICRVGLAATQMSGTRRYWLAQHHLMHVVHASGHNPYDRVHAIAHRALRWCRFGAAGQFEMHKNVFAWVHDSKLSAESYCPSVIVDDPPVRTLRRPLIHIEVPSTDQLIERAFDRLRTRPTL